MPKQVDAKAPVELTPVTEQETTSSTRRGFFGTMTKAALGVVAAVSTWLPGKAAMATYNYFCCTLALPSSGGACPWDCNLFRSAGYHGRWWYCYSGSTQYQCYECTKGPTCWYGPWLCSDYFQQ